MIELHSRKWKVFKQSEENGIVSESTREFRKA
jgi:hypothetical protein